MKPSRCPRSGAGHPARSRVPTHAVPAAPTTIPAPEAPRHLHVFLDGSGGTDTANGAFLAAAIAIAPGDAVPLAKGYLKATRTSGGAHGHWW